MERRSIRISDTEDLNRGRRARLTRSFEIWTRQFPVVSEEGLKTAQVCVSRRGKLEYSAVTGWVRLRRGHQHMLIRLLRERNHSGSVAEVRGLEHEVFHEIPGDHDDEHKSKPAHHKKLWSRSATSHRPITRCSLLRGVIIERRVKGVNAMPDHLDHKGRVRKGASRKCSRLKTRPAFGRLLFVSCDCLIQARTSLPSRMPTSCRMPTS